jgi:histidinol-phosphate aminotransferase
MKNNFDINILVRENVLKMKPYSSARKFEGFDTTEIFWMPMKILIKQVLIAIRSTTKQRKSSLAKQRNLQINQNPANGGELVVPKEVDNVITLPPLMGCTGFGKH